MDGNATVRKYTPVDSLFDLDDVVTICTEACCFTGLLRAVTCDTVKLVTRNSYGGLGAAVTADLQ